MKAEQQIETKTDELNNKFLYFVSLFFFLLENIH